MNRISLLLGISAMLLAGCATQGVDLPNGTLLLGEVRNVLTPADIAQNRLGPVEQEKNLGKELQELGFTPEQVAQGRVVVLRKGYYWNNTLSGIHHDLRTVALVPEGMKVEPGYIVEYLAMTPDVVHRVRGKSLEEAKGRYDELPTSVTKVLLGVAEMVGPSGAATLYCEGLEKEGWQRPRTYWHKLPAGVTVPATGH